jgi:hypothetical protein
LPSRNGSSGHLLKFGFKKKFLAFEWDLRDIDGATHFQGMAMKF